MKNTAKKLKCVICKRNPAEITYADSMMDAIHGFTRQICRPCKNRRVFEMMLFPLLSNYAKRNLVINPYGKNPMTMNVIWPEVKMKTKLGDKILKELFEDDETAKGKQD